MLKLTLLALALSAPAFAAPIVTDCQLPELSGSVVVTFGEAVTTKLVLDNVEIPMVRSSCFYKDVPGQRGYLCAHQSETTRYDVYPIFNKGENGSYDGTVKKLGVIRWSKEGKPTLFETKDCR